MIEHDIVITWKGGGAQISKTLTAQSEGEDNRDITVNNAVSNLLVDMELDISQLKSFFIVSNKDVTLKTNDSGTPQDTIALKADKPLIYAPNIGMTNPFGGDVTSMYLSNASGATATVQIRALFDATPQ